MRPNRRHEGRRPDNTTASRRRLTEPSWLKIAVVTAILSAIAAIVVDPHLLARGAEASWALLPRDEKPLSGNAKVIRKYVDQTASSDIWVKKPVVFSQSTRYFEHHFWELDPGREHRFIDVGTKVVIERLVPEAGFFSGVPVITYGKVATYNLFDYVAQDDVVWILQLRPVRSKGLLVYCRFTAPFWRRYRPGEKLFARGIVLAAGHVRLGNGGTAPMAYMACSAVARPAGRHGRGEIPAIPGYADRRWGPPPPAR